MANTTKRGSASEGNESGSAYDDARSHATGLWDAARRGASDARDAFAGVVIERPVRALLVAAGVGMLIGMFAFRRSRS